jgi:ABC-type polysaccharide/polyol phosphate export permease
MGSYLLAIWRCRYFWLSLVKMDLRTRYRRSILGLGWSLLHPIAMTIILCAAFYKIFNAQIRDFAPYLLSGMTCWNYICTVSMTGCSCFISGETYIRQHPAPLAIYPLRTVLGGTIHFLISMSVVLVVTYYMNGILPADGRPHQSFLDHPVVLVALVPALALLFLFTWSLALLAGFANVFFQDTQHLCEIAFQIFFYLTPIMYPAEQLDKLRISWLIQYNPVVPFLNLVREPVLHGAFPGWDVYATASMTVLVLLGTALVVLVRLQRRLIFYL